MDCDVVIAPDKFKGSLSSRDAAKAIQRGLRRAAPHVKCCLCPMADGGEGTVDAFLDRGAMRKVARVHDPLGRIVEAVYAQSGDLAVVEMAAASGLALLREGERDPLRADTFGTGELIRAALDSGAKRLIIGLGGSATNDAGIGALRALGARFLGPEREEITGGVLDYERLAGIDLARFDERIARIHIEAAVDVDNPLCGINGAARTFAAQKGAHPDQVAMLNRTLEHVADVAQRTLQRDYRDAPGAGAAGGLGFALVAFLGAEMKPGVELVARESGLEDMLKRAKLCMTGEGKIDEQTLHGKVVRGVAEIARKRNVRVVAFAGAVEGSSGRKLHDLGVEVRRIAPSGTSAEESMSNAAFFLEAAAATAFSEQSAAIRGTRLM
jgi:glycerate kinase